jgi:translation initiation factor 2 gamma subunit (eIF-2gamma)
MDTEYHATVRLGILTVGAIILFVIVAIAMHSNKPRPATNPTIAAQVFSQCLNKVVDGADVVKYDSATDHYGQIVEQCTVASKELAAIPPSASSVGTKP